MNKFEDKIKELSPEHDYPAGLIHPYWARKPLNVIEEIVNSFSKEGDVVLDPFMGSGTTLIAAAKNGRIPIGGDLSPVSGLLVKSIFESAADPEHFKLIIKNVYEDWIKFAISLYLTSNNMCVERENFKVIGQYTEGMFKLSFLNAKVKPIKNNKLKGSPEIINYEDYKNSVDEYKFSSKCNLSDIVFTENTRIAVHRGVRASDFFTKRNEVFIDYALSYIEKVLPSEQDKNFARLFLSSMIPLLRLSDKKASSQWPFWRPKEELTSRNPVVALERRYKSFNGLLNWEEGGLKSSLKNTTILNCAATDIANHVDAKVDLIITDPPYADHAPYMEYSDLYWSIISGERTTHLWSDEIVKTNAVGRELDSNSYESRMYESIYSCLSLLKENGYFVFFYLDKNINHWSAIKRALIDSNVLVENVIAITKQRRSMKSVTSPGKTLDGDLIVICRKSEYKQNNQKQRKLSDILEIIEGDTYFDRFACFIKEFLNTTIIDIDSCNLKDISRII